MLEVGANPTLDTQQLSEWPGLRRQSSGEGGTQGVGFPGPHRSLCCFPPALAAPMSRILSGRLLPTQDVLVCFNTWTNRADAVSLGLPVAPGLDSFLVNILVTEQELLVHKQHESGGQNRCVFVVVVLTWARVHPRVGMWS